MNKLILVLPNFIRRKYVLSHFSELSVTDFFEIVDKVEIPGYYFLNNEVLSKNSAVLECMLDKNTEVFEYFDPVAFSPICINKIAVSGIKIYPYHIDKYPFLLQNTIICERIIKSFPNMVKKLVPSQITGKIIALLEKSNYIPDEDDIEKSQLFVNSEKLFTNAVRKNPNLLVRATKLSNNLVDVALKNGFIPLRQHFFDNPIFKNYFALVKKGFEYDPSLIIFYENRINYEIANSARKRGFIAEEKDLLFNPFLCDFSDIMEEAIKKNPRLIIYVSKRCYINKELMIETLKKYKITKEDLEKNPQLTRNDQIMGCLPEYRLYYAYLNNKEKQEAVFNCLKNGEELTTENLPFLDYTFGANVDIKKISELLNYLRLSINENDINEQQGYFGMLDKIIDGIVNIRYIENKTYFIYSDIVSLNESLVNLFEKISKTDDYELIKKYAMSLHKFVGEILPAEEILEEVDELYQAYVNKKTIDLSETSDFCNKILNLQRNSFIKKEKRKILLSLEKKMRLANKKKNKILNGRKLKKVEFLILREFFDKLGTTKEEFQVEINKVIASILNNKHIKKKGIMIDSNALDYLVKIFMFNGVITNENVMQHLKIYDKEVVKYIVNRFEKIKLNYIDKIELSEEESVIFEGEKRLFGGINQTNYIIGDNERYLRNLSELIVKLDVITIDKILKNKNIIREVACLLPFVNLIDEFDLNTFINILTNCERVKYKILGNLNNQNSANYRDIIFEKFFDLYTLSNGYGSLDDITLMALGKSRASELGEHNALKYLDFYIQMLNRQSGHIPPISLQTPDYKLESGNYSDPDRLLIGKIPKGAFSCIDLLDFAGVKTYSELLIGNLGDVILIKDSQNHLFSRLFLFRRGNIVQIVSSVAGRFSTELYKEIANQIIQKSILNDDNIDYVFANTFSVKNKTADNSIKIEAKEFDTKFPHADMHYSAILVGSKKKALGIDKKESDLDLNFDIMPKATYLKSRKKISYEPTESEITRLRALRIALETNAEKKENMSRDFEPFYRNEYSKAICGEDWYIAIKKDGTLEELILPLNDSRAKEEMEQEKRTLGFSAIEDIEIPG